MRECIVQTVFVLPGLDGTGDLLKEFAATAPDGFLVKVLPLPDDPQVGYEELADHFSNAIQNAGRCVIIGESFSGPLAVKLAHRNPESVTHLFLVATFIKSPIWKPISWLPWSLAFRLPLPKIVARLLVGRHSELFNALGMATSRHSPKTLAGRIKALATIDVTRELQALKIPISYLQATNDRLISSRHAQDVCACQPSTILHLMEGPHLILQVAPQEAWLAIRGSTDAL